MFNILDKIRRVVEGNLLSQEQWTKKWGCNEDFINSMKKDLGEIHPFRLFLGLVKPKSLVLAAGCGPGREVKFLTKEKKCDVIAVDISKKAIESSKKLAPKAKYYLADMVTFTSPKKAEYITCIWNTINYLPNQKVSRKFIINAYKNLKPGGKLLITTNHMLQNLRFFTNALAYPTKNYYYFPTQINKWFKGIPFSVARININETLYIIATKLEKNG